MALTVAQLAPAVLNRLEDPTGIFWSQQFEVYTAIMEALNDLILLIGRPTQIVNQTVSLSANTCWQSMPAAVLAVTDIYSSGSYLRRVSLFDMDFVQSSWGSNWESDTSATGPLRWFPLGFNLFGVHPAPTAPFNITVTGIQYPSTASAYPYNGSQSSPFHDEMAAAIEMYATHYCRLKEGTGEFQSSLALYKDYLAMAQRLTTIEDKRDPVIFSPSLGTMSGTNSLTER